MSFMLWWSILVGTPLIFRLRILGLPYWYDEALTMHYVRQNFDRMLQLVFSDLHVPLYYIILYAWIRLFGDGQVVTGALSFIIGLMVVYLIYRLGRVLWDTRTGILGAAIYWVSATAIYFSTETRMYNLLTLFALMAVFCLLFWRDGNRFAPFGWILLNAFGVFTHQLYLFFVVAQFVVVAVWIYWYPSRMKPKDFLLAIVGFFSAISPLLIILVQKYYAWYLTPGNYFSTLVQGSLWAQVKYWLWFPNYFFLFTFQTSSFIVNLLFFALVIVCLHQIIQFSLHQRALVIRWLPTTWQTIGVVMLSLVPVFVLAIFNVHIVRYIVYVVPFWSLWLAFGIQNFSSVSLRRWGGVVLVSGLLVLSTWYVTFDLVKQPDFRWPEVMRALEVLETTGQGEAVLVNSYDWVPIVWEHYHGHLPVITFFPPSLAKNNDIELAMFSRIGLPTITQKNIKEIFSLVASYRSIWLINTGASDTTDPGDYLQKYLYTACTWTNYKKIPVDIVSGHSYEIKLFTKCHWPKT